MEDKFTCPSCGYKTFSNPPGSDEICPICFWEDDISQLRYPLVSGANKVSLYEAQLNFIALGAILENVKEHTRNPSPIDTKDADWRVLNIETDLIQTEAGMENYIEKTTDTTNSVNKYSLGYPYIRTNLYYWKRK